MNMGQHDGVNPGDPGRAGFRLAIIGGGRMGRTHLAAISGAPTVTIAGVVEPDPASRDAVTDLGGDPYPSLADLLAATSADGALVVVPTDRHVEVVAQVMAAGLPVLCEKPCGVTVEETSRCAAIAEQAGLPLRVAYWRRFVPGLVALRQRIASGEFGDVLAVNCYQWDLEPPSLAFRASSGGIFADMGVHEFDQVRWLTGREFGAVRVASARAGAVDGDPDCAQLVAGLVDGAVALVSLGRWHPAGDMCRVEVFGTKATASCLFLDPAEGTTAQLRALRAQAEEFASLVRAGGAGGSCATVADALAAQQVVAQARQVAAGLASLS